MRKAEQAGLTTTDPETPFSEMLNAIRDCLRDHSSSDDGEDGEDKDDDGEDLAGGELSEDDEPGWVTGTISKHDTASHGVSSPEADEAWSIDAPTLGRRCQLLLREGYEYGMTELKVPAVVQPQTPDDAASSLPTTFCEPMETLDSVPWNLQIPQVTSRPGSSRMRLGSQKPHTQRQSVLPSGLHARLGTDSEINAHWTHKLSPLHIESQANYQIEIGFRGRHSDLSTVARAINRQIGIYDNVSILNAIPAPILLCVSFYMISVTKLWDMIIRLCMCKGRIGHATFLNFNSHCLTTDVRDIILPVTVKWDNSNWIADKTH